MAKSKQSKSMKFGDKLIQFLRIPVKSQEIQLFLNKHPNYSLNDEIVFQEGVGLKPLDFAIRYNNAEVVRLLLERGAQPYNQKFAGPVATLLRRYNIQDVPEKLRILFQFGYNPNYYNHETEHTPISDLLRADGHLSSDITLSLTRVFIEYGFNTDGMSEKAIALFEKELNKLKRNKTEASFIQELSEYYEIFLVKQKLEQLPEAKTTPDLNKKFRL